MPLDNTLIRRVTILGSGTCVPSLKRSSCSVLVEIGDRKILLDAGLGTIHRLLRTETGIFDISYIFFSHFHPDHTSELVPFLFANKYPNPSRREKKLTIIAGKGFKIFFEKLTAVYGDWITLADNVFDILELNTSGPDHHVFDGFQISSMPVKHRPESIAIKITAPGGSTVVYSGDTDYDENLVKLSSKAKLLICECAMPDEQKLEGHLTPSLAGKIASMAEVSKLVLIHFYPECDKVDIEKQSRKTYKGPLVLAKDLMVFTL